jgi:hypothetical protein
VAERDICVLLAEAALSMCLHIRVSISAEFVPTPMSAALEPPLVPVLNPMNEVHNIPPYLPKTYCNIPIYTEVFRVISFLQAFWPKFCMHKKCGMPEMN